MDYENKKTLVILKQMVADGKITQEDAEKYFPELKKSEDESIIRDIRVVLESSATRIFKENGQMPVWYDRAIAWLEKQGEQNYKIIKGKIYFCVKTHNYAGVEWIKGTKYYASDNYTLVNQGCECYCPEYSKEEHNNLFEEVKCDGCVEKKVEQNLAWSEEDETTKNNISHIIRQYNKISKKENQPCWYVGDCLLWIQNIKDRVGCEANCTTKKEWSDEEKKMLGYAIKAVQYMYVEKHHSSITDIYVKTAKWLKSIRSNQAQNGLVDIEKVIDWLKENVTYINPRTGKSECVVNLNAFREAFIKQNKED